MKMKLTVATAICLFSTIAHSEMPGFYVNVQWGPAKTRLEHPIQITPAEKVLLPKLDDDQFAYRLGFGYQFDQIRSIEFGYRDFGKHKASYTDPFNDLRASQRESAFDITGKWSMVLSPRLNGYMKAGAALVKTSSDAQFNGKVASDSKSRIQPAFGLGLSYALTSEWPLDFSWNRIQHLGSGAAPSSDFYSVGLSYYFG